jgi:hemerythrin-like domain-containing protein
MPIAIGATVNTFANPIDMLSDCHRRIERFLQTLLTIATQAVGGPLNSERRHALETALRYFREAAPKHTADEEEDLFPMLRRLAKPRVSQLLAEVAGLEADHHTADIWHREADEICRRWLRDNRLSAPDTTRLQQILASLSDLYRAHIAAEEERIFPLAQAELSASEKQALGRHMAARRQLSTP